MPHFSDDLYLGPVYRGGPLSDGPSPMDLGLGPLGRVYIFDVVPVAADADAIAASQTPLAAGNLTLTNSAGVTLDVPRAVTVTAAGANTATFIVYGYDQYGQQMSAAVAAPSTSTVATTKAFKRVTRVAASGLAGSAITVGFNDALGLPVRVLDAGYIISQKWDGVADVGTFVPASVVNPATIASLDVRGLYTPSSAADGVKRLVMAIALSAIQVGPNATRLGALGITQNGW